MEIKFKKQISESDYWALEGIRVLATRFNQDLQRLILATADITGEVLDDSDYGHASDFIYCEDTVKSHLNKLGIIVIKNKK